MTKRKLLTAIVAFVLLAAVVAAGLNAIFTVTYVRLEYESYSLQGSEEGGDLREKLDAFVGKSTTFLDLDDVAAVVAKYPAMRLISIEKRYPTVVRLVVRERRETFTFARQDGYAVLDEEGKYLYDKQTTDNRAAGKNILLEGFSFTVADGEVSGAYLPELTALAAAFRSEIKELRANILSVTVAQATERPEDHTFRLVMQEGVMIDIAEPAVHIGEKAACALEQYLALSDEERTGGYLTVVEGPDGIHYDYSRLYGLL